MKPPRRYSSILGCLSLQARCRTIRAMVPARMHPSASLLVAVAFLSVTAGCALDLQRFGILGSWLTGSRAASAPQPPSIPVVDLDSTELPWAQEEEYFIIVRRSCGTLSLYRWGQLIRSYPAVFGMNPLGAKLYEGDRRTPTGFYTIIQKRPHPRWARFLLLDYPNATDADRYAEAMAAGELPQDDYGLPGMGGAIGIHGSDKQELNAQGIDWTLGCISLTNSDAIELDALVPVGTPVWIEE